ncbi:hypothetical protein EDB84DRAFT_1479228 [Lactarius hengduanensis]|nr:hypothetical protein EDB84DRAFT_1479228 [Lactarius hengduanensis]
MPLQILLIVTIKCTAGTMNNEFRVNILRRSSCRNETHIWCPQGDKGVPQRCGKTQLHPPLSVTWLATSLQQNPR